MSVSDEANFQGLPLNSGSTLDPSPVGGMPPAADGASLRWGTRAVSMEQVNDAVTELAAGRYTLPPELYVVGIRDLAALLREKARRVTALTFGTLPITGPTPMGIDRDEYITADPPMIDQFPTLPLPVQQHIAELARKSRLATGLPAVIPMTLHRLDGRLTRAHRADDTRLYNDLPDVQPGDIVKIGRGSKRPAEQVRVIAPCDGAFCKPASHPTVVRGFGGTMPQAWRAGQRVSIIGRVDVAKP